MNTFLNWIDQLPWLGLIVAALALGVAPVYPEPHLVQKIRMLMNGTLSRPLDIFDLCMHSAPLALIAIKYLRQGG